MYRYIKGTTFNNYIGIIDIVMYFEPRESKIAANRWISQDNVPENERITNYQLSFYDDFIDTLRSIMIHYFGKIISGQQSSKSYSYYINVETKFPNSDLPSIWQFRLRASNHVRPRNRKDPAYSTGGNTRKIFRSIVIGKDEEFKSYHQAILAVDKICKDISTGNFDAISEEFFNTSYTKEEYEKFLKTLEDVEECEITDDDKIERNNRRKDLYDRSPDDTD